MPRPPVPTVAGGGAVSIALVLFLVAGLSTLARPLLVGAGAGQADARLVTKNQLLEQELEELTTRVDTLQFSLEDLSRKDEYYRLLAGLEPLDADVLLAGIGGPDGDSLEASPLFRVDSRAGRRAFSTSTQLNSLIRRARVLAFSWREAEDTLSEKLARLQATPSIYPTRGYVSSAFSNARWHPILDRPRAAHGHRHRGAAGHAGGGIGERPGQLGRAPGRVRPAGRHRPRLRHVTRYAHLSKAVVRVGQTWSAASRSATSARAASPWARTCTTRSW
jgi:hypothetical protein